MNRTTRLSIVFAAGVLAADPALAADVIGAGSGSTGGTITGKTNETSGNDQTGVGTGNETTQNGQDKSGVGTGDNAVLNAPREAVPGTLPKSQPSNLNGENQKP